MVVQHGSALVEAACMPRVAKPELLIVEVLAEFVTERAQECSKGRDLLTHCRPHPHSDQHGFGIVVTEQLCRPIFADSQRSGCEHTDAAVRDFVELRCGLQKLSAGEAGVRTRSAAHRGFDGFRAREQASVLWQVERPNAVAFEETCAVRLAWRSVRKPSLRLRKNQQV